MCVLTASIAAECKNGLGGISNLWAVEQNSADTITITAEVVTAMTLTGARVFFGWKFAKDSAIMDMDLTPSIENGTTTYGHKLGMKFWKYETTKRNEIKAIAVAPIMVIAKDSNGVYWLLGKNRGLDMQPSTATTGSKLSDFAGFDLTFMSEEPNLPIEIDVATITSLNLPA